MVDIDEQRAEELASLCACPGSIDVADAMVLDAIDIVIVSTINASIHPLVMEALRNKKHVLCEKPLGCNAAQAKAMVAAAESSGCVLKTGFNHRHHPAIKQAKALFDEGKIGELHFMRARYGHGGRHKGMRKNGVARELSGGGELLDQGVHILDLFRWFAGNFKEVFAQTSTNYWNIQVEDNAFAILKKDYLKLAPIFDFNDIKGVFADQAGWEVEQGIRHLKDGWDICSHVKML
ncbi:MAG: Gfo/Idh/MocA family oxidoreductase [Candidatus Omnitrophica bacterium]|nr:Gfo/Idh/MocA family oxidoreductase [Candidatus Omnitrophota bacterium]